MRLPFSLLRIDSIIVTPEERPVNEKVHQKRIAPLGTILLTFVRLAEVPLQQALEGLAVTGLVAGHLIKTCAKAWFCVQLSTTHLQL